MNKKFLTIFMSLFVVATLLFLGNLPKANATAVGTAGAGDECNVHASDASHICAPGLVCVPQNDNSEGNGKCKSTVTPTPTPTVTPTVTPVCNSDHHCVTPTVTPTATPTTTPTVAVTPTDTPNNGGGNPGGDGRSDGLGCASHPCGTSTSTNNSGAVLGASTQAVLGASTMAGTGTFDTTLMNYLLTFGTMVLGAAGASYAKEKRA